LIFWFALKSQTSALSKEKNSGFPVSYLFHLKYEVAIIKTNAYQTATRNMNM